MHLVGLIGLFVLAMAAVTTVAVLVYSALPQAMLKYAERHGRFQGLADQETLVSGTRAGEPPARALLLTSQLA